MEGRWTIVSGGQWLPSGQKTAAVASFLRLSFFLFLVIGSADKEPFLPIPSTGIPFDV